MDTKPSPTKPEVKTSDVPPCCGDKHEGTASQPTKQETAKAQEKPKSGSCCGGH